jgi:hypothetical protein
VGCAWCLLSLYSLVDGHIVSERMAVRSEQSVVFQAAFVGFFPRWLRLTFRCCAFSVAWRGTSLVRLAGI